MSAFDTLQKAVEELGDTEGIHLNQINMLVAKRANGVHKNAYGAYVYPDYMGSTDAALTLLTPLQDSEHRIEIKWQSWNRWECLISNGWDVYVSCESAHLAHAIVKAWWAFEDALIEPSDEG